MGKYSDDFKKAFNRADQEFKSQYADVIRDMKTRPKNEVELLLPDVQEQALYDELIPIVEKAKEDNLDAAQLRQNIQALGEKALWVAKKVPELAVLLT